MSAAIPPNLRTAIGVVAALNLAYFAVETTVALAIGSAALFADSADFFEDAAVNFLILAALGWSLQARVRVARLLAAILMLPALAFVWTLWRKVGSPVAPEGAALSLAGTGALVVNLFCALLLARFRKQAGSLVKAAYLSARNDVFANLAIIGAGLLTVPTRSIWPDIVVGVGIALMNLDAAREVLEAAREEQRSPAA